LKLVENLNPNWPFRLVDENPDEIVVDSPKKPDMIASPGTNYQQVLRAVGESPY